MRISDLSSYVCSSYLRQQHRLAGAAGLGVGGLATRAPSDGIVAVLQQIGASLAAQAVALGGLVGIGVSRDLGPWWHLSSGPSGGRRKSAAQHFSGRMLACRLRLPIWAAGHKWDECRGGTEGVSSCIYGWVPAYK